MNWNWFSANNLLDLNTTMGALILAVIMGLVAAIISRILTKIMSRPRWRIGHLGRKVDETVIRYILRLKTLIIFIIAGFIYASVVPGLRALVGTLIAGAGITALIVGFACKINSGKSGLRPLSSCL